MVCSVCVCVCLPTTVLSDRVVSGLVLGMAFALNKAKFYFEKDSSYVEPSVYFTQVSRVKLVFVITHFCSYCRGEISLFRVIY